MRGKCKQPVWPRKIGQKPEHGPVRNGSGKHVGLPNIVVEQRHWLVAGAVRLGMRQKFMRQMGKILRMHNGVYIKTGNNNPLVRNAELVYLLFRVLRGVEGLE